MRFRPSTPDEPELNLIPFIDILLVVLIFLVLTTTYSKTTELQINLPEAQAEASKQRPNEVVIAVSHDNRFSVNGVLLDRPSVPSLSEAMAEAARGDRDSVVIINADAAATHQSVISVMDAARRTGLAQITFSTQSVATPAAAR
jgi:biopolymer transport protein ExbD